MSVIVGDGFGFKVWGKCTNFKNLFLSPCLCMTGQIHSRHGPLRQQ